MTVKIEAGSLADMESRIDRVRKHGAAFDKLVQETAIMALAHHIAHDDIEIANKLIVAMPKGSKQASLVLWFCAHGKFKPNAELDKEVRATKPVVWNKAGFFDADTAKGKMWYSMTKDPDPLVEFDIRKKFEAFLKQCLANKDIVNDTVLLSKLQAVMAPAAE